MKQYAVKTKKERTKWQMFFFIQTKDELERWPDRYP